MKNFMLVLLALGLVATFGLVVQAKVTGLPHVYNLTFNDQGNPGKDSSENGNNGELKGGASGLPTVILVVEYNLMVMMATSKWL